jgi:hypothetical protein
MKEGLTMPTPIRERPRPPWPPDALSGRRSLPDLSLLPNDEAERVRDRVQSLEKVCGCGLGAALALVALAAYVGCVLWLGRPAGSTWVAIAVGFGVFVLAAGAGKTLGLMRARSQRGRLLDEVYARVASRAPEVSSG